MDAPSSSILSDASSVPPAQNEPVIQEDEQNDKTAEEQELAAAQQRIDALPNLKILSIMRKALPKDAHIHAAVDDAMRACVAKFTGILTKEAKQQQTLARHKALESEDIINALKKLGFEDSSTALALFFYRFRAMTNHSLPQQVQLPVYTSELIQTEMQQQGNINVPKQGITRGDPTSSLQYWGNATMPQLPFPSLPSWPASYAQPVPMQQTQQERTMWRASNPQIVVNPDTMPYSLSMQPTSAPMQQQGPVQEDPLNFTPFSGDALFPQSILPRSDESISQHVPMQMMNPQLLTEGHVPNLYGYQQAGAENQQQNVGVYDTTMPADGILGTRAGDTSDSPLDQEMTDADIAYVLDLLKD
ncbi:CCAAT-binding protein subunit HAP3 [Carex littledalei]|uniref:CCAAT-binding protein subunit HAP3 n=1 Tax=Carex littledalei TaxID=544730 RepID=A0A833QCY0_9POAL|nr:CCAAT-binding protein subunit HAP3 [Carex littledalei]